MGVDKSDLIQTVVGGKTVWKDKKEVTLSLEKRSKLRPQPKVQRSLRGGENSVVGDIAKRLHESDVMLDELKTRQRLDSMEYHDTSKAFDAIAKRVNGLMDDLVAIEERIESRKENDPFVKKMDEVARQIATAQAGGDQKTVADLATHHAEDLKKYQTWRRSLQPDIDSALHCRTGLLQDQRRVYRYRGDLAQRLIKEMLSDAEQKAEGGDVNAEQVSSIAKAYAKFSTQWTKVLMNAINFSEIRGNDPRRQSEIMEEEIKRISEAVKNFDRCIVSLRNLEKKEP